MAGKLAFMIVDEDKNNIISIKNLIGKVLTNVVVYHAEEGIYAWEFIKKQAKPMIIISSYEISGINGTQLLQKVKTTDEVKDSFFVMMTSPTLPKDQLLKIVQMGVEAYLTKPLAIEPLVTVVKTAAAFMEKQNLLVEKDELIATLNNQLLENAKQLQDVVVKIQKHRFSEQGDLFEKLAKSALWIMNMMDENNTEKMRMDLETAASMIHIGKLFLPDKSINDPVMIGGFAKNETMEQVPKFARELIEGVKGFEGVAKILAHLYENYDGSGIPDKIQGWEIPLGSRILRVVLDFEEQLVISKKPIMKVMETLDHESKRLYDFRCVTLLDQYLAASGRERSADERPMDPENLKAGNIISRSIITQSGIKLVSAGTILKEDVVQKIRSITASDPVVGYIWIKLR